MLEQMLEQLLTPRRRQMLRRLARRDGPLKKVPLSVVVAYTIVAAPAELALAYSMGRGFNFQVFILIAAGLIALRLYVARMRSSLLQRLRRMSLLPAVLLAAAGGSGIAWLSWWGLNRALHPTAKAPDPIDITKLALTIAGGVGAIVALVVAYRRQRDIEQGRFVDRFGVAAAQLGANQVAVRLAGVYAMAGIANESKGLQRQQCIDVMCGYLRLPYEPERGSNYQTKHIIKSKSPNTEQETENHFEYLQNDREVRRTIVRVIADHVRSHVSGTQTSWSANDFDFRTAYLEEVDFSRAIFKGEVRFDHATFVGESLFFGAKLLGWVIFDAATFAGPSSFEEATIVRPRFERFRLLITSASPMRRWTAMLNLRKRHSK